MEFFEPDLQALGAAAVYAVVFSFVFIESGLLVGFFLPGDSLLFTAGLVAASASGVDVRVLVAGVLVAAVTGDGVGYAIGNRLGRPWLLRRAERGKLNADHLARAEAFYERFGWLAVVVARFIPWVRTFTPVVAGASSMRYPVFLSANVVGALVWGAGLTLLGYYAASVDWLRTVSYAVAGFFVAASLVVLLVGVVRRRAGRGRGALGGSGGQQDGQRVEA